jgi:hypothetical protein
MMSDQAVPSRPDQTQASRRYTVHEAALLLGLSVDAVRKRAERGRLKKEKAADGTVYILLDAPPETGQHSPTTRHDVRRGGMTSDQTVTGRDALLTSLQDQIWYLRRELDIRNEEIRRKDRLLAAIFERIPELEPSLPKETAAEKRTPSAGSPEPRETTTEGTDGEGSDESVEAQEGPWRRSWWRRYFGF